MKKWKLPDFEGCRVKALTLDRKPLGFGFGARVWGCGALRVRVCGPMPKEKNPVRVQGLRLRIGVYG